MITEDQIYSLCKRWNIDQVTVVREYLQVLFLSYLYRLKNSDGIYFKGGTAIRLLYGSYRFSEDLDFTSLVKSDETMHLFKKAVSNLSREIQTVVVENFQVKKHSIVSRLKYLPGKGTHPLGIHLEISIREKPLTKKISPVETLFPISPYPIITHLSGEEILSEKIRAILKRAKGRDLFDVWFLMSKEVRLDWGMVRKKMAFYNGDANFENLISKIDSFNEKKLLSDLSKFLPKEQRIVISALKNKVKEKIMLSK